MTSYEQYQRVTPKRILLWVITGIIIAYGILSAVSYPLTLFNTIPIMVFGAVIISFIVKIAKIWNGETK